MASLVNSGGAFLFCAHATMPLRILHSIESTSFSFAYGWGARQRGNALTLKDSLMANRRFTQFFNTLHKMPVLLDCNFIVDSTNANGVRSLVGPGIGNVYMNTSITPSAGNPNPATGRAIIQFSDNYNRYFGGSMEAIAPLSGTSLTSGLSIGTPYVITSLGSSTLAQWITAGVPRGITPAIGVAFVALATSVAGGGAVQSTLNSAVASVEVMGNPNTTLTSAAATVPGLSSGAYIMVHFLGPKTFSSSGTTHTNTTVDGLSSTSSLKVGQAIFGAGIPLGATIATIAGATSVTISAAATASATVPVSFPGTYGLITPPDGTTVTMSFYLSNSSILSKGE